METWCCSLTDQSGSLYHEAFASSCKILSDSIHRPDFSCTQCLVAFATCWLDNIITINNLNWVLTMVPDTVPKTPLILTLSQWERCLYPCFFFFFFYRLSDETVPQRELDWSGLKSRCLWLHVLAALFGFLVPLQCIMEKRGSFSPETRYDLAHRPVTSSRVLVKTHLGRRSPISHFVECFVIYHRDLPLCLSWLSYVLIFSTMWTHFWMSFTEICN